MIFVPIAQADEAFSALQKSLNFANRGQAKVDGMRVSWQLKKMQICATDDPRSEFEHIEAQFSGWLAEDQVTVLVADINPCDLNPLTPQGAHGEALLAMLILAFPEVRWLFGAIRGYGEDKSVNNDLDNFRLAHGLHQLFQPYRSPLFDGQGLRDWVRGLAAMDDSTCSDAAYVPRRRQLAVAIDEETDYANLHAYTPYRFGFKALAIARFDAAQAIFGKFASDLWQNPQLVLEDLYLNFPDGIKGLSNLKQRKHALPKLESATYRILVTSGHRVPGDGQRQIDNRYYVAKQKAMSRNLWYLHKPHAGIFALWDESQLARKLFSETTEDQKTPRGTGAGYIWPPNWRQIEKNQRDQNDSGHSSPGILLLIARHMLDRAELMLNDGLASVEAAVHGAVLANDALELLGGKTPTTAAEALSLKHQFELYAECQFSGVKYHIDMNRRLDEIERDAKSIAHWFRPRERKSTALNIRMNIINKLVRILREYNQFDEEQVCMNQVRHLHNSLYMREQPWRFVFWPFLRYSEFLLSSFSRFTIALILWVGGLTWLFSLKADEPSAQGEAYNFHAFGHAMQTFLGNDLVTSYGPWSIGLSVVAILAGLAHLGIFISHLYMLVSKR